ncbi:O-Glycosyl hydrolase family 30 [Paenibacillus sp. oral taxon 786 str. D14]|uniref:glycoside hydrolase family 30 protein n=1 Tax=Paenibacillus sp. oral taxon 786 TaxID=652715 RepID=UPI0001AFDD00|nr:glycoside hydrolase family 30 protein [Paenibacillus sp. oral taxon 786]EES71834.1 O-Glycosyl hydrolase family 30 [Paenibacillus sp. oral taxon 786 str. D14]
MAKWVKVLTSRDSADRLQPQGEVAVQSSAAAGAGQKLKVLPEQTYQTVMGFGGAFTEAAAYTLSRISPQKREEVIRRYFDPEEGLGYTLGRVHIHSCDFALENYTYIEDGDVELKTFDISRDHKWVIPLVHDAAKTAGKNITMLASPWSPPAWMKTNGDMNHGGQLKPEYREVWALYYTKFIKAYREAGIPIWGITVQNEPAAVQTWDSCIYSGEEERDFVRDYLGPVMHREGLADVQILIWDHNRDIIVERASAVLSDPEAAKYVWGTGFHWYVSEAFENVGKVHELFPDKHLLFTEGCQEGGVKLGKWFTGERYGRNIIGDLNNWNEGFLDWNLVLDETGGPNHVGNLCDAPIIADTTTDTLHYNSSYFYIGHFSKYIKPGAVRIGLEAHAPALLATSFRNPDGSIAVVVQNESDEAQPFALELGGEAAGETLPAHSIATYIIQG